MIRFVVVSTVPGVDAGQLAAEIGRLLGGKGWGRAELGEGFGRDAETVPEARELAAARLREEPAP